jgi:hypothetical protein
MKEDTCRHALLAPPTATMITALVFLCVRGFRIICPIGCTVWNEVFVKMKKWKCNNLAKRNDSVAA